MKTNSSDPNERSPDRLLRSQQVQGYSTSHLPLSNPVDCFLLWDRSKGGLSVHYKLFWCFFFCPLFPFTFRTWLLKPQPSEGLQRPQWHHSHNKACYTLIKTITTHKPGLHSISSLTWIFFFLLNTWWKLVVVRVAGMVCYFLKYHLSVWGNQSDCYRLVNQRVHELCYIVHGTVQESMPETNITRNLLKINKE